LLLAGVFLVAMCKDRRAGIYAQNGIFMLPAIGFLFSWGCVALLYVR
jgi:hypothetical protein